MKNKKGVGISMEFIVAAAIGLVVVFLIIFVFTGKVGSFRESTETCYSKGGKCAENLDGDKCTKGAIVMYTKDCKFQPESAETKDRLGQCCVET